MMMMTTRLRMTVGGDVYVDGDVKNDELYLTTTVKAFLHKYVFVYV